MKDKEDMHTWEESNGIVTDLSELFDLYEELQKSLITHSYFSQPLRDRIRSLPQEQLARLAETLWHDARKYCTMYNDSVNKLEDHVAIVQNLQQTKELFGATSTAKLWEDLIIPSRDGSEKMTIQIDAHTLTSIWKGDARCFATLETINSGDIVLLTDEDATNPRRVYVVVTHVFCIENATICSFNLTRRVPSDAG